LRGVARSPLTANDDARQQFGAGCHAVDAGGGERFPGDAVGSLNIILAAGGVLYGRSAAVGIGKVCQDILFASGG
jgi:hypothetical protein